MKIMRTLATVVAVIAMASVAVAQDFDQYFDGRTLRLDYIFAGNDSEQHIYLEEMKQLPQWAGRRTRLSEKFLAGDGQITVRDSISGEVIYVNTFSTLFQEWQSTEEATKVDKAFETSYLVPFPKNTVEITVTLTDRHHHITGQLTHMVNPTDILIRQVRDNGIPVRTIMESGPIDQCVDIVIVAEGYTEEEMDKFYTDAQRATDAIFSHEPFAGMKDRFNVVAVASASLDSGPCIPHDSQWKRSALDTHYDTFYTDRYLTTQQIHTLYDIIGTTPVEQIIVLINSPTYGGGGIYNQVTLSTTDHRTFKEVLVHEFGHGYGGLADEYYYDDQFVSTYPADTEPWEPNVTTLVDFSSKWQDMIPEGIEIPTTPVELPNIRTLDPNDKEAFALINAATQRIGVFEGGGYQSKGVYRPAQECRMKINEVEQFCPVCLRAIVRITDFYTGR